MTVNVQIERLVKLREPFKDSDVSTLPKPYKKDSPKGRCGECGGWHGLPAVHLEYVGHAALTARLLDVDPTWTWEPVGTDDRGLPAFDADGGLWIKLTVAGHTRLGYGDAQGKRGPNAVKEAIGDALRNAAMRFGAALDLWHKGDLSQSAAAAEGADTDGEPVESEPTPASLRARIAHLGAAKHKTNDEVAADFVSWSTGVPITTDDMELLARYINDVNDGKALT
jgi:hypothetical protein